MNRPEVWKAVDGTDGKYEVSNTGRVRSNKYLGHDRQKELSACLDEKGYPRLRIYIGSNRKSFRVHQLVARAFIPNPNNLPQVNHIDANKQNNTVDNLEWVTNLENHRHKEAHGLDAPFKVARAEAAERRKKAVIITRLSTGDRILLESSAVAQAEYGMRNISEVLHGRRCSTNGYSARFVIEGVV